MVGQGTRRETTSPRGILGLRWRLLALAGLLTLTACTTTRSRPLNRTESDQLCVAGPATKGIPVTIRVPTHVDVWVYEKVYFQRFDGQLRQVPLHRPVRWVDVQGVETNRVVTVDWKRPFSGSLDYTAEIGSDQYFDALGSKISDTTIQDVSAAVQTLAAMPTKAAAVKGAAPLLEEDRLIAYCRFDVDSCDLESQIIEFVALHLEVACPPSWSEAFAPTTPVEGGSVALPSTLPSPPPWSVEPNGTAPSASPESSQPQERPR